MALIISESLRSAMPMRTVDCDSLSVTGLLGVVEQVVWCGWTFSASSAIGDGSATLCLVAEVKGDNRGGGVPVVYAEYEGASLAGSFPLDFEVGGGVEG